MVKIGYTIWYKDFKDIKEKVVSLMKLGFNYLELSLDYPLHDKEDMLKTFNEVRESLNIDLGIHAPWRDVRLASPIDSVRVGSLNYVMRVISKTSFLNPSYILVHLSTNQAACEEDNSCIEAAIESLKKLNEIIRDIGADLVIETIPDECCTKPHHLNIIASKVEDVMFCIDITHFLSSKLKDKSYKERSVNVDDELKHLLNGLTSGVIARTLVMHVHGFKLLNRDVIKPHLPLRESAVTYVKKLVKLVKPSYILLEVFKGENTKITYDLLGKQISALKNIVL